MNQIIQPSIPQPASQASEATAPAARPDVIAIRKTCDAEGTGLSHYVLMDKRVAR